MVLAPSTPKAAYPVRSGGAESFTGPSDPDRPIRILDITKFYGSESGGVRTYLDAKIRDFSRREVLHTLVIPGESAGVEEVGRTRIHRVPGPVIPFAPNYRLLTSQETIERIIERERPDLIEVGSPFLVPFLTLRAVGDRPIPVVGFYHSDLVRTYAEPYVRSRFAAPVRVALRCVARRYIPSVYGRFDATVAATASVAEDLSNLGVPRVHTVPFGVDLETFNPHGPAAPLRKDLGIPEGVPIAIYVGRLCEEKRLDVVLDAHLKISESSRPHLIFVGDGHLRDNFSRETNLRTGMSVLPYEQDRERVARLLRGADFYLAAGPGETFGLAIAEAVACGLPVVAVDMGAAPDRIADSGSGVLYRHGDSDSCAAALMKMAGALSPGLSHLAHKHAESAMGWDSTFNTLLDLYGTLIASRR